nr:SPFH domain-containing protein [Lachnospiraceae bacterium]
MNEKANKVFQEREIVKKNGMPMLLLVIAGFLIAVACIVGLGILDSMGKITPLMVGILIPVAVFLILGCSICCAGLHLINPNEAMVFTLFGEYYGTIKQEGFYFLNPFAGAVVPAAGKKAEELVKKKVSLKTMTLNNQQQKVNDALGNPIIIGAIVIWKVVNPTKALFEVDNYQTFLSTQCDSTIRNVARLYPYDLMEEEDEGENHEKTLRGSSQE